MLIYIGCDYFIYKSYHVMNFRYLVSIKVGGNNVSVSTKVSIDDPFSFVHEREWFILGNPINSIASLSPDV
jgi:hypothetical protein